MGTIYDFGKWSLLGSFRAERKPWECRKIMGIIWENPRKILGI
jgi:hypothetical protein